MPLARRSLVSICVGIAAAMLVASAPQAVVGQQPPPGITIQDPPDFLQEFERGESAFYFLDEEGNPSIWPGMTFEEIERLKNLENGISEPQLDYDISHCSIEGTVRGQRADLKVHFEVDFRAAAKRWIAIPLGLRGFHQTDTPTVEGLDDWRWTVTKQAGYVLWAHTSGETSCSATIPMTSMVRTSSDEVALAMDLPATVTEIKLSVPQQNIEAQIQEDQYQVVELDQPQDGQGTTIRVLSTGGAQTLVWSAAELETATTQAVTSLGEWLIRWPESDQSALAEIEFTIENLRGPLESFEITLPSSITLRNETFASNDTVQISASSQQEQTRLAVVPDNAAGSAAQVSVRLYVELPVRLDQNRNVLRIPPIRVENAFKERGNLTVELTGDSRLRWTESSAARITRTAADPTNSRSTYEFSYSRIPIDLEVWQEDSQDQVRISPSYQVAVSKELLKLQGRITGSALNKTGQPLVLDVGDWTVGELSTGGLRLSTSYFRIEDQRLIIEPDFASSYSPSDASTSSFDLRFTCTRSRGEDADQQENTIAFTLPQIVSSAESRTLVPLVEPATVVVEAEAGFKLTADPELTAGLMRLVDVGADERTLQFRQQAVDTAARFVGYLVKDRPIVAVRSNTSCKIDADSVYLRQVNQLTSTRQAIDSIPLVIPAGIDSHNLTATVAGVPAVLVQATSEETGPPGRYRIIPETSLPGGTYEFTLEGEVPLKPFLIPAARTSDTGGSETAAAPKRLQIAVPVAFPDTPEATREIEFLPTNLQQSGWALDSAQDSFSTTEESGRQRVAVAGTQTTLVAVPVQAIDSSYRIDRLLIRTHVGTAVRHDQATLQLSGTGDIVLHVPDAQDVQILRDGKLLSVTPSEQQAYRIPLGESDSTLLVVSIWQRVAEPGAPIPFPWSRIAEQASEAYWQITLPKTRYAVVQSPAAQPAWSWQWQTWRLVRVPTMSDAQLASWVGAGNLAPTSPGNTYLYQVGSLGEPWVTSISSSMIWSIAAVTTLALAALLVYVPLLRTTLVLFTLVAILCATALRLPDATLLFLQYVLLACGLLVVVAALRQIIVRPHPKSVFGKRPALQSGSTHTAMRRSEGEPASSTMPQPTGGPPG